MKKSLASLLLIISLTTNSQSQQFSPVPLTSMTPQFSTVDQSTGLIWAYDATTNHVSSFNGGSWHAAPAFPTGTSAVNAISAINGQVTIGCSKAAKAALYQLNGSTWSANLLPVFYQVAAPTTANIEIYAMKTFNNKLYFIGDYSIYSFDGTTVTPIVTGASGEIFRSLEVVGNYLYFSGNFTQVNGNTAYKAFTRMDASGTFTQVAPTNFSWYTSGSCSVKSVINGNDGYIYAFGQFKGTTVADSGCYRFSESAPTSGAYKLISRSKSLYHALYYKGMFIFSFNTTFSTGVMVWYWFGGAHPFPCNSVQASSTAEMRNDTAYYFCSSIQLPSNNTATTKWLWMSTLHSSTTIVQSTCHGSMGTATTTTTGYYSGGLNTYWENISDSVVHHTASTASPAVSTFSALSGTYYSVNDDMYRLAMDTITFTQPAAIIITANSANETAPGVGNGTATASSNLTGTYSWSNGNTTAVITGLHTGWYVVTFTSAPGCTKSDSVFVGVNTTTGITEYGATQIKIFPNPATDVLHIEGKFEFIKIYNCIGQLVLTSKEEFVNISGLSKGMYVLEANGGLRKFVKN